MEAAIAKGRDLPAWYLEEPELEPGDAFYLSAFYELSTTRAQGFGTGPIPWQQIVAYSDRMGFDAEMAAFFHQAIRTLDNAYVKWAAEQQSKSRK